MWGGVFVAALFYGAIFCSMHGGSVNPSAFQSQKNKYSFGFLCHLLYKKSCAFQRYSHSFAGVYYLEGIGELDGLDVGNMHNSLSDIQILKSLG